MQAATASQSSSSNCRGSRLPHLPARTKLAVLATVNLCFLAILFLVGEVSLRLFWHPKYQICCERWLVGCGMTTAGRKYWPNSTYRIQSDEFSLPFRTNARGYRARPEPTRTEHPYRIAFVGDSFTEAMQVAYDKSFCALIEYGLKGAWQNREVVCENYGIAATGLFEYWHRITHDVLRPNPPDALVLCIYPGNDFTGAFPADGFDTDGSPCRIYYTSPTWARHVLTWLNLNSQLARYLQERAHRALARLEPPYEAPKLWWTDPVVTAQAGDAPIIRRSRVLLEAIDQDCRRFGTRLCVLVVGPVTTYPSYHGESPLGRILADWKIEAPVIDAAIEALSSPHFEGLLFPRDGHLNESGHALIARSALPPLRAALAATAVTASRR